MRIVFFVNYGYYPNAPEDKRFQAKVSACLPKEPNESYISHCLLRSLFKLKKLSTTKPIGDNHEIHQFHSAQPDRRTN